MENIKQINIKNRTFYIFNNMINMKDFDSSLIKIEKESYKNIGIYHNGYITKKNDDYENIHSLNHLYLVIGDVEENSGSKYLFFDSIDKKSEILTKYTDFLDKYKSLIKARS